MIKSMHELIEEKRKTLEQIKELNEKVSQTCEEDS